MEQPTTCRKGGGRRPTDRAAELPATTTRRWRPKRSNQPRPVPPPSPKGRRQAEPSAGAVGPTRKGKRAGGGPHPGGGKEGKLPASEPRSNQRTHLATTTSTSSSSSPITNTTTVTPPSCAPPSFEPAAKLRCVASSREVRDDAWPETQGN